MKQNSKNKAMPFAEDDGYVERLVADVTETAISSPAVRRRRAPLARIAAMVAVVVGLGYSAWTYNTYREAQSAPLDTFLSSLSDEEAEMLECYYYDSPDMDDYKLLYVNN